MDPRHRPQFLGVETGRPSSTLVRATALTLAVGIPVAYLIAIFRYGLWNLDVVVKKTVQYGLLVALFVGLIGLVLSLASYFLVGTGGTLEVGPILLVIGVLAVGFNLLRARARRWANRVVYGRRSSPYEVMSEFADRVGGTYSMEDVLPGWRSCSARPPARTRAASGCVSATSPARGVVARRCPCRRRATVRRGAAARRPRGEAFEVRHQGDSSAR